MKKVLWTTWILALICALALAGCRESSPTQIPGNSQSQTTGSSQSQASDSTGATEPTVHVHAFGEWATVQDPTCSQEGRQERICACGQRESQRVALLAHTEVIASAMAPTCRMEGKTESKYCAVCGTFIVAPITLEMLEHTPIISAAISPTCMSEGLSEGSRCADCGLPLVPQEVVPKLEHKEKSIDGYAPTCTAEGLSAGKYCSVCGETLVEQKTIDRLGHTEVTIPAVPVTCRDIGQTEGTYCSVCNQTVIWPETIWPVGHIYQNGTCVTCGDTLDVYVTSVWMDNPGKTVRAGDSLTFYVEAHFKYEPKTFVLWFKSVENPNSVQSAVAPINSKTADNIYEVTLDISEYAYSSMFPGKWISDWYFISDQYGTFIQEHFSDQAQQDVWFTVG